MNVKRISYLAVCVVLLTVSLVDTSAAQNRDRVIKTVSSRPINQPSPSSNDQSSKTQSLSSSSPVKNPASRPVLTNNIQVTPVAPPQSLVKKTGISDPVKTMSAAVGKSLYSSAVSGGMLGKINSMLGIPYRYGSTGPNRYDCSGFVWAVFNEVGINFERTSARTLWQDYEPAVGDDRYKFGTLVFFNKLGHVGIVADENGFYHASSSKGITYSKFDGYWEKRIVGFRKIPMNVSFPKPPVPAETLKAEVPKVVE